ncbi:MAG: purine biosynthesis protein PurH [Lachnospiraceae bacterium]|nr:purine biosynthesis protein PurH [Candidatus Equihabitans merdae]
MKYLIKDTTKEERAQIVAESLGYSDVSCDGCSPGIVEMYQPYIDGVMELSECNMAFNARYVKDMEREERGGCGMGVFF